MSNLQKGLAVVYGVDGITFTAGIVSATNGAQTQSLRVVRSSDKVEIKNDLGDVVGQIFSNGKKTLSITVIPSHATVKATAQSSYDAHLIPPGTTVTIADANGAVIDDDYNLLSATGNMTNDGVATIDLELESYDDNDVTVATS